MLIPHFLMLNLRMIKNLEEDNEILAESNSVNSSQSELLEPCEYENIRNNNIAELNAKLAEAQEAGLF